MDEIKVGGEVDAWCTTCKDMKWHVVVAVVDGKPAKVECNGCHKQHAFKATPPGTPKPRAAKKSAAAEPPEPAPIDDLEEKLKAGEAGAKSYSARDSYEIGDVVRHPSFGLGLVAALPAAGKVELAFRSGRKLLVHRLGQSPQSTLQRPPPRDDSPPVGASDAPPPPKTQS